MKFSDIDQKQYLLFNHAVSHPLQSIQWGEFRKETGVKVIRKGILKNGSLEQCFQLTIHHIPHAPWSVGYIPKCILPTKEMIEELKHIGKQERCIFIQLEPNIQKNDGLKVTRDNLNIVPSAHPLFTTYTFVLDLTPSEDEILKKMHPKTRYNIKVAQKHGVTVQEDNSPDAFQTYLKLSRETTARQKFYAHAEKYHRLMWQALGIQNSYEKLSAHLLVAKYNHEILAAWILLVFKDTLYYPYGASSSNYREVMASNLMMWEAIRFGKKLGLKKFDLWGALGPTPDPDNPWYGFHRFKQGYGPRLIEFVGSYDLIINPVLYEMYKVADKLRWLLLRMRK